MNGNKGLTAGAILAVIAATISLAVAFGVHISTQEREALVAEATAIVAIAPAVGAIFDHGKKQAASRVEAATVAASTMRTVEPPLTTPTA